MTVSVQGIYFKFRSSEFCAVINDFCVVINLCIDKHGSLMFSNTVLLNKPKDKTIMMSF